MISAVEALKLEGATLSATEEDQVNDMISFIDRHVRANMRRSGCNLQVLETNTNVIAEVSLRLRSLGWNPQWQPIVEQSSIRGAQPRFKGYNLAIVPSEASYEAASKPALLV